MKYLKVKPVDSLVLSWNILEMFDKNINEKISKELIVSDCTLDKYKGYHIENNNNRAISFYITTFLGIADSIVIYYGNKNTDFDFEHHPRDSAAANYFNINNLSNTAQFIYDWLFDIKGNDFLCHN